MGIHSIRFCIYVCSFHTILYLRLFIPYDFVFTFVYCVYNSIGNQQAADLGHPILHYKNIWRRWECVISTVIFNFVHKRVLCGSKESRITVRLSCLIRYQAINCYGKMGI